MEGSSKALSSACLNLLFHAPDGCQVLGIVYPLPENFLDFAITGRS
jgi:hypothetical protein